MHLTYDSSMWAIKFQCLPQQQVSLLPPFIYHRLKRENDLLAGYCPHKYNDTGLLGENKSSVQ